MQTIAAFASEALSLLPHAGRASPAAEGDRGHGGPGWFDSSWELGAGLQVKEGLPADLGVVAWIDAWLQLVAGEVGPALSLSAR